jgi:hypothetical protein
MRGGLLLPNGFLLVRVPLYLPGSTPARPLDFFSPNSALGFNAKTIPDVRIPFQVVRFQIGLVRSRERLALCGDRYN